MAIEWTKESNGIYIGKANGHRVARCSKGLHNPNDKDYCIQININAEGCHYISIGSTPTLKCGQAFAEQVLRNIADNMRE